MHDQIEIPDIDWYSRHSENKNVQPRCPFATVEICPRYYQSLSLLGNAGSTSIDDKEDERLKKFWEKSDLWPKTGEYETSISGPTGNPRIFSNYCPEITYDRFGYFASFIAGYADEIDNDQAVRQLSKINAPQNDWRWYWGALTALHYTNCNLYSTLDYRSKINRFPFGLDKALEEISRNNMTLDKIFDELRNLSIDWKNSGYQHFLVEALTEQQKGFVRHPPKDIDLKDQLLCQFLMIASIQHGGNWFFWLEKSKNIDDTLRLLVKTLSVSYKRVVFRILYALQIFDKNQLDAEMQHQREDIPNNMFGIVSKYVNNNWSLDYLKSLSNSSDEGTKSRAASVISEIEKYSPYDFLKKIKQITTIFISYNHKDSEFVNEIVERFQKENIEIIIDANNLKFGDDIQEFIKLSTENTEFTLSIMSRNSLLSPWVLLETLEALMHERVEKKKKYLPVIIDNSVIDRKFYHEAKSHMEKGIRDLIDEIYELSKGFNHTKSLENEKERLIDLRNNFDKVIDRLKSHLYIDFSTAVNIEKNFPKLLEQIKANTEEK